VHAIVVVRPGSAMPAPTIEAFGGSTSRVQVPRSYSSWEEIPRTGSGKI